MGLFTSVKKRFTIQFVGVRLEEQKCKIQLHKLKNGKLVESTKKSFDIVSKDQLSKEVITYLNYLQDEHQQTYITLFLNTLGQGAIDGCNERAFEKLGVDKKSVKSICLDNSFSIYASKIDINWVDKVFAPVGLDFVFSPFLILYHYIQDDLEDQEVQLFILNTHNGLTMMIMQGEKLLYGAFFNVAKEENLLHEDFETGDESTAVNIEDDLFDEIEMDDNDEMQALDDVMEYDDIEHTEYLSEKDARFVKYLDASLKEFYNSDLYENAFITKVKIYDDAGMHKEVIKHIENELLLDTSAENINLLDKILEIAEDEVMNHA
ncbi:MAG: hypothetical protein K0U47_01570 [Epsilonproteobacteria bacterium]|nr:hypothetical protein [Campylobacterota bacterium]